MARDQDIVEQAANRCVLNSNSFKYSRILMYKLCRQVQKTKQFALCIVIGPPVMISKLVRDHYPTIKIWPLNRNSNPQVSGLQHLDLDLQTCELENGSQKHLSSSRLSTEPISNISYNQVMLQHRYESSVNIMKI